MTRSARRCASIARQPSDCSEAYMEALTLPAAAARPPDMDESDPTGAALRRPRATARGEASRETLLDQAIELIGEGGYGALSVSALCKRAGVSPTSLYWHFGDKAGLMTEMVRHSLRRDAAEFLGEIRRLLPALRLLDAYVSTFRKMVVRDRPTSWSVITALGEGRDQAPEIIALLNSAKRLQVDFAESWVGTLCEAAEPRTTAHAIVAFNTYAANHYRHTRNAAEVDEIIEAMRSVMRATGSSDMERRLDVEGFDRAIAIAIARTRPLDLPGGRKA